MQGQKAACFAHGRRYGVALSVEVGFGLSRLVPVVGKALVTKITAPPRLCRRSKALAIANLSVVASPFAILPSSTSWFGPLAPYCLTPLLGCYPTAPHRVAPYCYSPAGTQLLLVVGWYPLFPVAPLASLSSPMVAVLLWYAQSWYRTASVAAANAFHQSM